MNSAWLVKANCSEKDMGGYHEEFVVVAPDIAGAEKAVRIYVEACDPDCTVDSVESIARLAEGVINANGEKAL